MRKAKAIQIKWRDNNGKNYVYEGKGYGVSYNPSIQENPFDIFLGHIGGTNNIGNPETAFYDVTKDDWIVLNGDHRNKITSLSKKSVRKLFETLQNEYESGNSTNNL